MISCVKKKLHDSEHVPRFNQPRPQPQPARDEHPRVARPLLPARLPPSRLPGEARGQPEPLPGPRPRLPRHPRQGDSQEHEARLHRRGHREPLRPRYLQDSVQGLVSVLEGLCGRLAGLPVGCL